MKNILSILAISLFLAGCSGTKELKNQTVSLAAQVKSLESTNADLSTKLNDCTSEKNECSTSLANLSAIYAVYNAKIIKLKSEIETAFPKNLNDANFAVVEEDGRLIVRLPNAVLYKSGSAEFSGDALLIIQKLTKIFAKNASLNILIEGHTDDVPLSKGSKYEDNWDLSMARAVKITRQFETYGIHPQRLTAAGRASFAPIDNMNNDKARAKNRRTEITIRPQITEILKEMSQIN